MNNNPFEITKAVDFTDPQIAANWVDLPGGGFSSFANPTSPMPRFLVGGKGGGRTHLLRYFSYSLQRLRNQDAVARGIRDDGYVGIYLRCGGLNSSRFSGKRQEPHTWEAVFSYYTEVWLGRLTIDLIRDVYSSAGVTSTTDETTRFVNDVVSLFDIEWEVPLDVPEPLAALADGLKDIQRRLDVAINNAALTHQLDLKIGASPGRLVFGIPAAASEQLSLFSGLMFAYILDEYENLTFDQQKYVNTLIREKQLPTTFLVGSRQYGLKTHLTLSAGEENKHGSEYDLVVLEGVYRTPTHQYDRFCEQIVQKRLEEAGFDSRFVTKLAECFAHPRDSVGTLEERAVYHLRQNETQDRLTPWLERLQEKLVGAHHGSAVAEIVDNVRCHESPLHERFAILLLYRAWADGNALPAAAQSIRKSVQSLFAGQVEDTKLLTAYQHYKHDLYAQILDDLNIPQEYFGISDFIKMSGFLPRNLLVVLKQVTRWSLFLGEQPFRGTKVSTKAQQEGVREASSWFLSNSKGLGRLGEETQIAVRRLGSLLRDMRFSDKPVEVSCIAFSTDRHGLTASAARTLDEAVSHDLVLEIPRGRRERNSQVLHRKYILNPMLAPTFDLPLALRGSANFSAEELNAIFDPEVSESTFNSVRRRLLTRLRAPFQDEQSQSTLLFE